MYCSDLFCQPREHRSSGSPLTFQCTLSWEDRNKRRISKDPQRKKHFSLIKRSTVSIHNWQRKRFCRLLCHGCESSNEFFFVVVASAQDDRNKVCLHEVTVENVFSISYEQKQNSHSKDSINLCCPDLD